jgi:hypothetical protein
MRGRPCHPCMYSSFYIYMLLWMYKITECGQIWVVVDIQQFVGKRSKLYYIFMCLWAYTFEYQQTQWVWRYVLAEWNCSWLIPCTCPSSLIYQWMLVTFTMALLADDMCHGTPCLPFLTQCDSFLFPKMKNNLKTFWNCGRDSEGYNSHSKQLAGEWLLEVVWQMETVLEFMYSCRREKETTAVQNTI